MGEKSHLKGKTEVIIFLVALVFVFYILKTLLVPLILAVILSVLIFPVQKFLEKKWKCNRLFATGFSISITFIVSVLLLFTLGTQLSIFIENSDIYILKITELYNDTIIIVEDVLKIKKSQSILNEDVNFGSLIKDNFDKVSAFAIGWGSVLSNTLLIPIYMFFFLYYRRFFRSFAYRIFKNRPKSTINKIIQKIYEIQRSYLLGLVKVMIIVGTLNSIGLLLLGVENAIFFGYFAGILLVIPYVGIIVGSLLPALVALATKDSYLYAIGVIAVFGFIQFIEGYFITPKVIGSDVSVNSFIAIIALLSFAMLWGIPGMIIALPMTATLKILFDNSSSHKALGFIIGEPEDKFLRSKARARLKNWGNQKSNS